MNYWKQLNHVMKYFRVEEKPKSKLPSNFISGFLEASHAIETRPLVGIDFSMYAGPQLNIMTHDEFMCDSVFPLLCIRVVFPRYLESLKLKLAFKIPSVFSGL